MRADRLVLFGLTVGTALATIIPVPSNGLVCEGALASAGRDKNLTKGGRLERNRARSRQVYTNLTKEEKAIRIKETLLNREKRLAAMTPAQLENFYKRKRENAASRLARMTEAERQNARQTANERGRQRRRKAREAAMAAMSEDSSSHIGTVEQQSKIEATLEAKRAVARVKYHMLTADRASLRRKANPETGKKYQKDHRDEINYTRGLRYYKEQLIEQRVSRNRYEDNCAKLKEKYENKVTPERMDSIAKRVHEQYIPRRKLAGSQPERDPSQLIDSFANALQGAPLGESSSAEESQP